MLRSLGRWGAGKLPLLNSHLLAANFGELAEGRVGDPPKLAIRLVARERFAPGRTRRTWPHSGLYTPEPSRGRRRPHPIEPPALVSAARHHGNIVRSPRARSRSRTGRFEGNA